MPVQLSSQLPALPGVPVCRLMVGSLCRFHWFEIKEKDGLPFAAAPCPVRQSYELRARPCHGVRAEAHRIPKEFEHLLFRLTVNKKPAMQRFSSAEHCAD